VISSLFLPWGCPISRRIIAITKHLLLPNILTK
jgi:hypothetical protein